ncbi:hypothetical protein [Gelidibacter sp. F63206]|uniref:hypothetical protein n=1 Tax=Gelidibacter sp. F63206 TaxID=2926425 RepID=UPI001FF68A6B|nr:hypothetical protein [Gelidibacter sp. F63206]MCK0114926.1 hypothetical protein [Gelidibacter sp. F63206]
MNQDKNIAVSSLITIKKPNEKFIIYKGEFVLKNSNSEIETINGQIYFKWFPHIGPIFNGEILNGNQLKSFSHEEKLELLIDDKVIADCFISNRNIDENHTVSGGFYNRIGKTRI